MNLKWELIQDVTDQKYIERESQKQKKWNWQNNYASKGTVSYHDESKTYAPRTVLLSKNWGEQFLSHDQEQSKAIKRAWEKA
jgi:hypothetical protein